MTTKLVNSLTYNVPEKLKEDLETKARELSAKQFSTRLFAFDSSLWTSRDENKWLDWLNVTTEQEPLVDDYQAFAREIKESGFNQIVLLGMGGSSLAPEVFSLTFGSAPGYPVLSILDSTCPDQVKALQSRIDLSKTLFVVASKSGSTLEPNIFMAYFLNLVQEKLGDSKAAGEHFVAITDPGSKLEAYATEQNFRRIFKGVPAIGGRYSVLSPFGLVPFSLMGLDTKKLLAEANFMRYCCQEENLLKNPGAQLGLIMGLCQAQGRDKLTLVTTSKVFDFAAWLEQLIAESTGKLGKAIIPVDLEPLQEDALAYGDDRLFVFIKLDHPAYAQENEKLEAKLAKLALAGHPVVTVTLEETYNLGQEFFRFEIATALAGSLMEINPFDQPDVEASKIETRELTQAYEKTGSLPEETAFFKEGNFALYSDEKNILTFAGAQSLSAVLRKHLARLTAGDYFAVLAYIEMNAGHVKALQEIRELIFLKTKKATCLGFGPRFLHSTGQAYKGGANNGVFLQITANDKEDLKVPGQKYSFATVKAAQARGDFQVLVNRGRRALRIHLQGNLEQALAHLHQAVKEALG
jgi:glucose-6-phosphate isomerase